MFGKTNEKESNPKITKQDIIDYINKMEIKKAGFGGSGLDMVDVYRHIEKVVFMYDAYLKGELEKMEARHEEEIAGFKEMLLQGDAGQNQSLGQLQQGEGLPFVGNKVHTLRELEKKFKVSEQEIIDYINKMEIKKGSFLAGGLDKVDVYAHIQEMVVMYDKMTKAMKESYEEEITRLHDFISSGRN